MEDLIKIFSIDWKLVVAQIINFTIVILVLGIYALKPLTKIMQDREDRINRGIKDAEAAEEKMREIEKEKAQKIKEGRKEAQEIIASAEKQAELIRQEKLEKTQKEVEKVIVEARGQIREEREVMVGDVKKELGGIIGLALNRVTSDIIDEKKHHTLIDDVIAKIEVEEKIAKAAKKSGKGGK